MKCPNTLASVELEPCTKLELSSPATGNKVLWLCSGDHWGAWNSSPFQKKMRHPFSAPGRYQGGLVESQEFHYSPMEYQDHPPLWYHWRLHGKPELQPLSSSKEELSHPGGKHGLLTPSGSNGVALSLSLTQKKSDKTDGLNKCQSLIIWDS